ncbi:MAG: hypothetical protein HY297_02735 [Thaumarchaeota archaeon]|nr:hypothetical protein [Nitrososphaerota archaeon]
MLETALALAVGFALLAGTALLASKRRNVVRAAAVFGFLASVVGALNSLALFALGFSGGYISETIAIGAFLVLFFGFPLAMTGYFSELIRSETEAASAAGPT